MRVLEKIERGAVLVLRREKVLVLEVMRRRKRSREVCVFKALKAASGFAESSDLALQAMKSF